MSDSHGEHHSGDPLLGRSINARYRLTDLLGRGGMGSVYKAEDCQMGDRIVAIKVLSPALTPDEKQVTRFIQESQAANQLKHPNTIRVMDFGRTPDGHLFMVMEFLEGVPLTRLIREGSLDPRRACFMMRQMCKSLAEAHSKGIVHRDLKPDNIFVCDIFGEPDFIKVIDFGIAKFLQTAPGTELTQAGKMFGTPRYLSPEQATGSPLDHRSDLYSLGVILYEMLVGRPPFDAEEPIAIAVKHVQEQPPELTKFKHDLQIPQELDRLVFKLLEKDRNRRPQSAQEIIEGLDVALGAMGGPGQRHVSGQYPNVSGLTPAAPLAPLSDEKTLALDVAVARNNLNADKTLADPNALDALESGEKTIVPESLRDPPKAKRNTGRAAAMPMPPEPSRQGGASRTGLWITLAVLVLGGAGLAVVLANGDGGKSDAAPAVARSEPAADRGPDKAGQADKSEKPDKAAGERAPQNPGSEKPAPERLGSDKPGSDKGALAATQPTAAPTSGAQPKGAVREIIFDTDPSGADVLMGGLKIGKTPYTLKVKPDDPDPKMEFKLTGFHAHKQDLETKVLLALPEPKVTIPLKKAEAPRPKVHKKTGGGGGGSKWDL